MSVRKPYTLYPQPLIPEPKTLKPKPRTLNHQILNPQQIVKKIRGLIDLGMGDAGVNPQTLKLQTFKPSNLQP